MADQTTYSIIAGKTTAILRMHLTDRPILYPYSLAKLGDVTWNGYAPKQLENVVFDYDDEIGISIMTGSASFDYAKSSPNGLITALYITAEIDGIDYLLDVREAGLYGIPNAIDGTQTYTITSVCYL